MQKTKAIAIKQDYRTVQHLSFVLLLAVVAYVLLTTGIAHADDPVWTITPGTTSPSSSGTDTSGSLLNGITGGGSSGASGGSSSPITILTTTTGFMAVASGLFGSLSPMEQVLCTILLIILGDAGRGIATLAVMGMGFGAMMGKVSWGQAMTVAVGVGIMFGAPIILPLILFDPSGAVSGLVSGATGSGGSIGGAVSGAISGGGLGIACM